jgi:hypothetical protein
MGLFTALVKAPCVPPELQVYTWIDFSFRELYQITMMEPKPPRETH